VIPLSAEEFMVRRRKAPPLELQSEQSSRRSPFASVKEAAEYLHESTRNIREMKARGILKLVPHPDKGPDAKPWRFLFRDLDEHIEKMRGQAA
jgi:hypothetical protein